MMTALLCAIVFASGVSALIFETLWFRQAGLAFGNSTWAASLVLSGFMGGLAMGSAVAARYGDRFRNAVRAYAITEVAIALSGVELVYLFPVLGAVLAPWLRPLLDHPWILNPLRLLMAFLLLLIPSTATSGTGPLASRKALAGGCVPLGILPAGVGGRVVPPAFASCHRPFDRVCLDAGDRSRRHWIRRAGGLALAPTGYLRRPFLLIALPDCPS
jgi:hypothetical protein